MGVLKQDAVMDLEDGERDHKPRNSGNAALEALQAQSVAHFTLSSMEENHNCQPDLVLYLFNYYASFESQPSKACGVLAPQPGIKSTPSTLEGKVLTTGPGKPFKPLILDLSTNMPNSSKLDSRSSPVAQTVKRLPAMQETRIRSLDWEDLLEKETAIHSSTLTWRIPRMEEPVTQSARVQTKNSGIPKVVNSKTLHLPNCPEVRTVEDFHGSSDGKESACNVGERNGNPFQYFYLVNPMDREAWWAAVYAVAQSDTTEHTES
ncbi:hypothetical protein MG293_000916 [Ovis ammon polii]|uniref:Uncharacterized protein n=1 Tax=Ovis ammon polii TaxID=230172 RepID=A0AAD4UM50_OVIAM|nr:hypothetical protein MG293_000916 [Ovis ammon polii]